MRTSSDEKRIKNAGDAPDPVSGNAFKSEESRLISDAAAVGGGASAASGANIFADKYLHAVIHGGSYCPDDYTQPISVTLGRDRQSKKWKHHTIPLHAMLKEFCQHKIGPKDGVATVFAHLVDGRRLAKATISTSALLLDYDTGVAPKTVVDALVKLGCLAICYTTHSHHKVESYILKSKLCKYAPDVDVADFDDAFIQRYLRAENKCEEYIIESARYVGIRHFNDDERVGKFAVISHVPMPKLRVVVPLAVPFVIDDEGATQEDGIAKWATVVEAFGGKFPFPFDRACVDPCRMFYNPRHDDGSAHETHLIVGPLFDWRTLELGNVFGEAGDTISKPNRQSATDEGRKFGKWYSKEKHRFELADAINDLAPDMVRNRSGRKIEIKCPNDASHSNAGDPNDRGCFAMNASDSEVGVPIFKCQHEGCRKLTLLDLLAMADAAGWFGDVDIRTDGRWYTMADGEEAQPFDPNEAKAAYEVALDALTPDSSDEEMAEVYKLIEEAKLSVAKRQHAHGKFRSKANLGASPFKKFIEDFERAYSGGEEATGGAHNDHGADEAAETVVSDGYGGALTFVKNKGSVPKGVSYDKKTGQVHPTYRNALLLIGSEGWDLGYNELSQNYGLRGEVDYPWPGHLGYALNDAIKREIRLWMLRRWGVTFKKEDIEEATMTLARRNTFNPVCDYLDAVEPQWDQKSRVDDWLETYMGVKVTDENRAYVRAVGKLVLVAAVRRARQPGCKFDEMLILEGPQGSNKSSAVKTLAGEYFSDSNLGNLSKKNAPMKLRGVWIYEIGELTALTKGEVDELKEFMSQQVDRYQIPYGKSEDDFPRRLIFIGTVNPGGGAYLADLTGNRRMWPMACGVIDIEALERDRDQLWAEAAMMESRGDSIRLDPSLYAAAKAEQDARLADDPWVGILADYLDDQVTANKSRATPKTRFISHELLSDPLDIPKERQNQTTMKKLKNAMELVPNWKYKSSLRVDRDRSAGYEYVPPPSPAK